MRSADDGPHPIGSAVIAVEKLSCGFQQRLDAAEQFAVGDLASEVPPDHFNRVEPRAVGRQAQQDQAPGGTSYNRLDFFVLMGTCIVPGNVDSFVFVALEQSFEQLSDFWPPFLLARDDKRLPGVPVDRTQTVPADRLHGR